MMMMVYVSAEANITRKTKLEAREKTITNIQRKHRKCREIDENCRETEHLKVKQVRTNFNVRSSTTRCLFKLQCELIKPLLFIMQ